MNFTKGEKFIELIGKKYTGKFEEYPTIIPTAIDDFKSEFTRLFGDSQFTRTIVYEPWRGPNHSEGYFYVGALVNGSEQQTTGGLEHLKFNGEFASLSTHFDVNRMGEYYSALDNWIAAEKDVFDLEHYLIEIYHPSDDGKQQLEIYMKINTVKESEIK